MSFNLKCIQFILIIPGIFLSLLLYLGNLKVKNCSKTSIAALDPRQLKEEVAK